MALGIGSSLGGGFDFGLGGLMGDTASTLADSNYGRITNAALRKARDKVKFPKKPFLAPVAPPRGATIRSSDPFDFFGTLFTTPATSGLNPINTLNKTVL